MENFPESVILEILLHLPVKSLLRFKCVSKSWLSLISHPSFAKLHFQRSSSQNTHRIFYVDSHEMLSIDINASLHDDSAIEELDFPPLMPYVDVKILGSSRGFLLLSQWTLGKLFLWNPATRVFKQITPPRSVNSISLHGFCYNESTDDYLLVLGTYHSNPSSLVIGFELFSVRSNSWENLALSYQIMDLATNQRFQLPGSILNGGIHWLFWHFKSLQSPREVKIIAFDITTKNLREVPTPSDASLGFSHHLGVLGGSLCLTENEKNTDEIKIWVMREYGKKSSWTKLISLSLVGREINFILPLCFTRYGQLVSTYGFVGLSKWSGKGELLEHRQYSPNSLQRVYTETLFSLP